MKKSVWVSLLILAAAGIGAYFYLQPLDTSPERTRDPEAPTTARAPAAQGPEHPVPTPQAAETGLPETIAGPQASDAAPALPPLAESDEPVRQAVTVAFTAPGVESLFNFDGLVRRMVVTIDNLPRRKLSLKQLPVESVEGRFRVSGKDDEFVLAPENYARYTPYVRLLESLDLDTFTDLYIHYYPLFQQAYLELGYPSGYFNDRLVEVIDHLLATPEVERPVRLIRPHVLYEFADPELERLSAGQKAMIRMGPENAERVRDKLREVRARLTGFDATESP